MSLKNIDRRTRMLRLRAKGATYEEIAKDFGLTRQRAFQIVNTPPSDYPRVRRNKTVDKKLTT